MSCGFRIEQYTPAIGAEIFGVDLNTLAEDQEAKDAVYDALVKYKVIFFRDQELSPDAHMKLARSFGEPEPQHPIYPHTDSSIKKWSWFCT